LRRSHANNQRLSSLILLIGIAYSCAVVQGQKIKRMGIQKYVSRLTEYGRPLRRPSIFWIELYGQAWVVGREFCQDIITLLNENQAKKTTIFSERYEGYVLYSINVLTGWFPRQYYMFFLPAHSSLPDTLYLLIAKFFFYHFAVHPTVIHLL
jgi:hypothetical protein